MVICGVGGYAGGGVICGGACGGGGECAGDGGWGWMVVVDWRF